MTPDHEHREADTASQQPGEQDMFIFWLMIGLVLLISLTA